MFRAVSGQYWLRLRNLDLVQKFTSPGHHTWDIDIGTIASSLFPQVFAHKEETPGEWTLHDLKMATILTQKYDFQIDQIEPRIILQQTAVSWTEGWVWLVSASRLITILDWRQGLPAPENINFLTFNQSTIFYINSTSCRKVCALAPAPPLRTEIV